MSWKTSAKTAARQVGLRAMANATVRRAALRTAASRDHRLVLMYHRVAPQGPHAHEIVPTFPTDLVRRQLQVVGDIADIVSLSEAVTAPSGGRLRVALTFDDDDPRFVDHVLPLLRDLGLTATFFLSGRTLHGLGPYWWELVEAEIAAEGLASVCRRRGTSADTPYQLARGIIDGTVDPAPDEGYTSDIRQLQPDGMRQLADAGMTIGFHTVEHPALPSLPGESIGAAVTEGRQALAEVVSQELTFFAYPYARFDGRCAAATRQAGYTAAFTGIGAPITRAAAADDQRRFELGRWEPKISDIDAFAAELALRAARLVRP